MFITINFIHNTAAKAKNEPLQAKSNNSNIIFKHVIYLANEQF